MFGFAAFGQVAFGQGLNTGRDASILDLIATMGTDLELTGSILGALDLNASYDDPLDLTASTD